MKILLINGPNMNMLGIREPGIYGNETYTYLVNRCEEYCKNKNIEIESFQSNHEGALVDIIQLAYFEHFDGIVINSAAYSHTSIAIHDAIKATGLPTVSVHVSDVSKREAFRQTDYTAMAATKTIAGEGLDGYIHAIDTLIEIINSR